MNSRNGDYGRIEQAIRFIEGNARSQPSLTEVARHVGLSEFHFQRVFSRWAGVSPKKFLQFLTAAHARRLLLDSRSVLEAAYDVGLSGGSRLHDLTVSLYGMTPGELKARGAGLTIRYGSHHSPFGSCLVAMTARGICALRFVEPGNISRHVSDLRRIWPAAKFLRDQARTGRVIRTLFAKPARQHGANGLALHLFGTPFQLKVWEALLQIPPGHLLSYQDLAKRVGHPAAPRAVGRAVGQNPVAYLIPCHRVIRSTGRLGEYRWGSARKKALVGWEAAQRRNP